MCVCVSVILHRHRQKGTTSQKNGKIVRGKQQQHRIKTAEICAFFVRWREKGERPARGIRGKKRKSCLFKNILLEFYFFFSSGPRTPGDKEGGKAKRSRRKSLVSST